MVIGIGTRYSDFTTASRTAFANPDVRFVNVNVTRLDSLKQSGVSVVADARVGIEALKAGLRAWTVQSSFREEYEAAAQEWDRTVEQAYHLGHQPAARTVGGHRRRQRRVRPP